MIDFLWEPVPNHKWIITGALQNCLTILRAVDRLKNPKIMY